MIYIYIGLIALSIILFGIGLYFRKVEKKNSHALFNSLTTGLEVLEKDNRKPRDIEKPIIISSTLIEENLEEESN